MINKLNAFFLKKKKTFAWCCIYGARCQHSIEIRNIVHFQCIYIYEYI